MSRPKNDDHDLEVMASWLYYVHGMGQEQVAKSLSLSRTKVTRLLSQARDSGLVKITLDHELAETLALADWIAQRYGLDRCILTPPTNVAADNAELAETIGRQAVGIAAANILIRQMSNGDFRTMGIGGGRTLQRIVDCIRRQPAANVTVISLVGTSSRDDGTSAYNIAQSMADVLGGQARTLPAPLFVGDPSTCALLSRDASISEILRMGESADVNLLGCGSTESHSAFFRAALLSEKDIEAVRKSGAVCEVAGIFLKADGSLADTPLNSRRIGASFDALRRSNNIVAAAGARKVEPLKAAIRSGIARTIVIDHEIAGRLVADVARKG